jgi:Ca-dependent carbohydrate-binding module xylan-binding/Glycosyl hydrolase family 26
MTTTPFPLGFFSSNPNGNDPTANAQFEQQYNEFTQLMGARPEYMDGFVDYTQDPSQWASNASWTAWSWAMTGNNYVGPGSGTIPVIGVPMASTAGSNDAWETVDQFYQQIIAGEYDADYSGIVQAWAAQGYTTMEVRIGYEFNGNFMAWAPGNSSSPTVNADFVAAWQHIANILHAAGQADGITVETVWNPDEIGSDTTNPTALYPGNQYVDIIGTDVYSPTYPNDLTEYNANGGETGQASNATTWAESITNREHWWQYPDANQWSPTGTGGGWSLANSVAFAQQQGKPLAIEETGAGGNGTNLGPSDDPAFPQWLASELQQAEAQGVTIQNVDIWATDQSDGNWGFLDGEKPEEAQAWASNFGASGAEAASQFDAAGSNDTTITAPESETATSGATTQVTGVSISDPWSSSQPGNVTLTIQASSGNLAMTDSSGRPVTSSGTPMITVTDTLANVDADLSTLTYQSDNGGADTITITVVNQAGNADAQTISINGGSAPAAPVDTGSSAPIGGGATPPTLSSSDISLVAPAAESDASGVEEAFTGVSISDPWAAAQTGNVTVTLKAATGVLSMTDTSGNAISGSGTSSIILSDTLADINADLSTLTYLSNSGETDVVSITATNQAGVTVQKTISVNSGTGAGGTGSGSTMPSIATVTIGSGPNTLALSISQDAWQGSSQFTVWVDGTEIGGTQTVNPAALESDRISQTFDILGTFAAGTHTVTVDFLNAASGGTAQAQRNLYVTAASIDGDAVADGSLSETATGPKSFTFQGSGSIPSVTIGSGPDTLALSVAQDAWNGNAQFTVSVDGKQIGGVQTVDAGALNGAGLNQAFDIEGNFAIGNHTVSINFLNDDYGGTAETDRNLYVTSASINGTTVTDAQLTEMADGSQSFTFTEKGASYAFTDSAGTHFTQAVISSGSLDTYAGQSGLNNNVHQWVDAASVHNVSTDAWAYVSNLTINDNTGASFATFNFVETNANLSGATTATGKAASLTVESGERGTITLGSGNYNISFSASNAWGSASDNTVSLNMGSGSDTFLLTGSNDMTTAVVRAGSGNDKMSFVSTSAVTVYGGSGTATATVTGGSGGDNLIAGSGTLNVTDASSADVFTFHAGDGLLNITGFSATQNDILEIDKSLLPSMHETATSGGLMISFGTDTTHGIMLWGVSGVSQSSIHAV